LDATVNFAAHPSAIIAEGALIGEGTELGPFAVIEAGAVVGSNCRIGAHAVIRGATRMGNSNQVFEGAVLGGPPQDLKYRETESYLEIGDGNVFREGVTVHKATEEGSATRIGNHCFLMACSHVAHECILGDHVILANNVALAGHVEIETGAFLSGGVVVHQFSKVGCYSMTGGNAKVEKDVLPYFLVDGVPARTRGLNLIGLKRADFSAESLRKLKQAYRILFRHGGRLEERLSELRQIDSPEVAHLLEFIETSQRGFCRGIMEH
jgi:UDP-N-acetylglucosamine acyltransferase